MYRGVQLRQSVTHSKIVSKTRTEGSGIGEAS